MVDSTSENEIVQYYMQLAIHITDYEVEDGVFEIYAGDAMHGTFSKEKGLCYEYFSKIIIRCFQIVLPWIFLYILITI